LYRLNNKSEISSTAGYFCKYFSKGFEEEELNQRSFNQKRYLNSKGLEMPELKKVFISDEHREKIEKWAINDGFHKKFDNGGSYNRLLSCLVEPILENKI